MTVTFLGPRKDLHRQVPESLRKVLGNKSRDKISGGGKKKTCFLLAILTSDKPVYLIHLLEEFSQSYLSVSLTKKKKKSARSWVKPNVFWWLQYLNLPTGTEGHSPGLPSNHSSPGGPSVLKPHCLGWVSIIFFQYFLNGNHRTNILTSEKQKTFSFGIKTTTN